MARETTHEFPATQVLMDLAVNRPVRTRKKDGANLHVCFDKKLKQNALNNFLMSHTPYRCSLGRPKETVNAKRRTKQANKAGSSELSLPNIPSVSESLIERTVIPEDGPRQQTTKRLIDLENEEEEEGQCNFFSCKSVKEDHSHTADRPTIESRKESRSRSLPLILKKASCSSCSRTDYKSQKPLDKLANGQNNSPGKTGSDLSNHRNRSSRDKEFTTVMEDGAKITVNQQRLFIEVFMPRTS